MPGAAWSPGEDGKDQNERRSNDGQRSGADRALPIVIIHAVLPSGIDENAAVCVMVPGSNPLWDFDDLNDPAVRSLIVSARGRDAAARGSSVPLLRVSWAAAGQTGSAATFSRLSSQA
jgi:hypothetical protein